MTPYLVTVVNFIDYFNRISYKIGSAVKMEIDFPATNSIVTWNKGLLENDTLQSHNLTLKFTVKSENIIFFTA